MQVCWFALLYSQNPMNQHCDRRKQTGTPWLIAQVHRHLTQVPSPHMKQLSQLWSEMGERNFAVQHGYSGRES
jgi:hypothetical protein